MEARDRGLRHTHRVTCRREFVRSAHRLRAARRPFLFLEGLRELKQLGVGAVQVDVLAHRLAHLAPQFGSMPEHSLWNIQAFVKREVRKQRGKL